MNTEQPSKHDLRRARLEEQLRENLKRRKEQARARRQPAGPAEEPDEAGPEEE